MIVGSLCSGIGGLELGVERALGATTAWQAEIDPAASAVLAAHWPGVPNLGDFRGQALPDCDILTAGFPCQPVSTAGRRAGINDERWLFDDIAEAVGRMGTPPRLLVFENVRGLLSANGGDAMARVVHGLAAIGYVGQWRVVRASDVGCCHQRARVLFAAHPDGQSARRDSGATPGPQRAGTRQGDRLGNGGGATATDPPHIGHERGWRTRQRRTGPPHSDRPTATDPASERRATIVEPRPDVEHDRLQPALMGAEDGMDWGPYADGVTRHEQWHGPAPEPTADGRLSPAFVCWMMGYPVGWVDGLTRNQALRCLGNAVVPQVAEAFMRSLYGTTTEARPDQVLQGMR